LLAVLLLAVEIFRHHEWRDWIPLAFLLAVIGYAGSKLSVSFYERERNS